MSIPAHLGYLALAILIASESAGIPMPGETSLVAAAALAAAGHLSIIGVICVAAAAAIVGDNIGYLLGRRGGRWLLARPGPFHERRIRLLGRGEALFERYGRLAVFLGRWIPVLRFTAAWLAGTHRMPWKRFLLSNGLGGVTWAASIGLIAYSLGDVAIAAGWGLGVGLTLIAAISAAVRIIHRRIRRPRRSPPVPACDPD